MSALQLALQAIDRLQNVARSLCADTPCVQFCATLSAILGDLPGWLRGLPKREHSDREASALLEIIDSLCRSPNTPSQPTSSCNLVGDKVSYPGVALLLANPDSVISAIRDMASDHRSQRQCRQVLGLLEAFLPPSEEQYSVDVSPSDTDLRAISKEPPECGKEIRSLHAALFKQCVCSDSDQMLARIRLRSTLETDGAKISFGMLFMAHPHCTQTDLGSQPCKFEASSGNEDEEIRPGSENPFCQYISAQADEGLMMMRFIVKGGSLYFENHEDPPIQWVFDQPSISLGQLLERLSNSTSEFTEKNKEVLSWLLAKSVWQYYSSPWMQEPWNKERVHFLLERRHDDEGHEVDGIFVNEPLLSVSIARSSGQETIKSKHSVPPRRLPGFLKPLHTISKLLALGVMLVEIQQEQPIETLYGESEWSQYCPHGKKNQNTDFKICRDLINRKRFFEEISDPLEALIRACIQPGDAFKPPQVQDEDGERHALYLLINRLEVYLSKRKPHNVKPLSMTDKHLSAQVPRFTASPLPIPSLPVPKVNTSTTPRPGRTMAQITNSTSTKDWFKRVARLNHILKANEADNYEKVKIAVLDTGIDPCDSSSVYVDGYRDFVSGNDSVKCDQTGHGTTSVNLIFDMCESAEVHVLRIFETDSANDNTQELAIQALDWCIKERMDVVCMACGFTESSQHLFDKVHEASGKMLILAAPTNESNAGEIAYPARYDDDVMCIFSTDGAVTKSQRLNPSNGLGKYNFAILGEDIMTMSGDVRSGTSFSTAIAAGLAARLLEFSRHSDCQGLIYNASMLKLKYGMTKALMAMAIPDSEFLCLKPWKLLREDLRSQIPFDDYGYPDPGERDTARRHICNLLALSLGNAWQ
ncbi:hypothetical protein PG991_006529 [Apiospora marii]|uniref:Peptidase S8/S53 domain-containing protein n=1 Tax=Apiospora marii TaxID=335849 RepID=A0ABR1RZD8_9PEZI